MLTENERILYAEKVSGIAEATYSLIHSRLKANLTEADAHPAEVACSYLEHRGKAIRPVLLALCAEVSGGTAEQALPACAAVEMYHTWTLMHDDVIDHDDFRRGSPSAHKRGASLGQEALDLDEDASREYGVDLAILGGDLLHAQAADMLMSLDVEPALALTLARRMCRELTIALLTGEQVDVRLSQTPWERVTESEIMQMMRQKTGALLAFAAECGSSVGNGIAPENNPLAKRLADFAHGCGLAFQLQDDWLGVFGESSTFGKPIGSDIREGKRTLLMSRTLALASAAARKKALSVLGRADASTEDIADVRTIIRESGAEAEVACISSGCVEKVMGLLEGIEGNSRRFLEAWADGMLKRRV